MSALENMIAFFAPGVALRRAQAKEALGVYSGRSEAGNHSRGWSGFRAQQGSSDYLAALEIDTLRARARDHATNNSLAERAIDVLATSAIGTGIMPVLTIPNRAGAQRKVRAAMAAWANSTACDHDESKTFGGIQDLAFRAMLTDGEAFVRKVVVQSAPGTLPLQLQVLEADYLDRLKNTGEDAQGNYTVAGIQYNQRGKRTHYWLFDRNPQGDLRWGGAVSSKAVPASEVIHLYIERRPGQTIGLPRGMAGSSTIRDLNTYTAAKLMQAQVAACFSVYIQSEQNIARPGGTSAASPIGDMIEPGQVAYLRPGETIASVQPPNSDGHTDFVNTAQRSIASAYGVPYAEATGDYRDSNFSSSRQGHLAFSRHIEALQYLTIIPKMCDRVFAWFKEMAIVSGLFTASTDITCTWTAPSREMVDPLKEINALVAKVRAGFMSWQEAVRTLGYDPDDILNELKADAASFDRLGLMPYSDPRHDLGRKTETDTDG